ncbi:BON domain-containing protein [Aliiglaciecola sp. CAU 1673]|uniref:BON domain-containing protein n=1 Tax=Aliiglaciecola sp. CAU 1673 TaxID=3032595 RepID=UPI0023DAB69F|nr:BON domain-containing protein [Aliiglaciecola sp. CAU 1673]MDF2178452.1 BON domain-containing protein [Aliiglaciecola sp. CAU 1673]
MKRLPAKLLLSSLLALSLLQGCAVAVVGAGVTAASAAHDRRTVGTQLDDTTLESKISAKLAEHEGIKEFAHINVHVFNGVALLVGQTPSESMKREAQQIAESIPNVNKLHNQIRIGEPTKTSTRTHDVWLATKVKTNLLTNKRVDGLHIEVIVEDAEVFLMGLVTEQESDIAVDIVRNVGGVARVVKAFEIL